MTLQASVPLDANGKPVPAGLPFQVNKSRAYTGASGLGAAGASTLFTVTGSVMVRVIGCCTEDLAGAATLEIGISGNTAALIAQLADATTLDAGESYIDATPSTVESIDLSSGFILANGQDIIETIGSTNITDGTILFVCFWRPLSEDGLVVAA